ncbi:unnamed protein product [Vitrella brassicaformis CCMP3155]|uniref:Uncharacterized protein n=2 Tax=Vitrella brassicaformis TaxID=1169539 RepID=A0A0G4GQ23_VITBC|nr:unnamed protein product [Vitrella brassicaformis CCMP3155]|eukprot:CEM32482.1 unnamed protein product [Vitrella brassicaformis CCMP3155]
MGEEDERRKALEEKQRQAMDMHKWTLGVATAALPTPSRKATTSLMVHGRRSYGKCNPVIEGYMVTIAKRVESAKRKREDDDDQIGRLAAFQVQSGAKPAPSLLQPSAPKPEGGRRPWRQRKPNK